MEAINRILGIVASPHNSGNTAKLVREVLKGAGERGYKTDLKCLGELKIDPLVSCASEEQSMSSPYSKKKYGVIGPKDDMESVYSSIERMNAFVFGTPIYYDHVSARAKIFFDRLIYYRGEDKIVFFPKNIPAVIVITYEWNKVEAYADVVEWIKNTLKNYWKMKVVAVLKAENTLNNPVSNRKELLEKAHEIGRNL